MLTAVIWITPGPLTQTGAADDRRDVLNQPIRAGSGPGKGGDDWLEIIWPETGLRTITTGPAREKNALSEDDELSLTIDFVTLSLSPLELIQLASFLRMSVDGLLDRHPSYQRAVVNAFDIKT